VANHPTGNTVPNGPKNNGEHCRALCEFAEPTLGARGPGPERILQPPGRRRAITPSRDRHTEEWGSQIPMPAIPVWLFRSPAMPWR